MITLSMLILLTSLKIHSDGRVGSLSALMGLSEIGLTNTFILRGRGSNPDNINWKIPFDSPSAVNDTFSSRLQYPASQPEPLSTNRLESGTVPCKRTERILLIMGEARQDGKRFVGVCVVYFNTGG